MLIIYCKSDKAVVANSGTTTWMPNGPEFADEVQNAIKSHGRVADDYGEYRLHDDNDAALVQQIMGAGSYTLAFDAEGNPIGIGTIYERVHLTCPDIATVGIPVTVTADAVGGAGIEAVLYIDGVEQARANLPAAWQVQFDTPGTYAVKVVAGRHGQVERAVVVS